MIQALDRESVAFAKSRGIPTSRVLTVHALRPSLVPIVTAIGLVTVAMLGSTILVEVPFALNGMGSLLAKSIAASDVAVIQGVTLSIAAVIIAINGVTDAACIWLDPQARGGARG
jgi:ABC-type dipeptide/oligopeptide/nickel transport system permease component